MTRRDLFRAASGALALPPAMSLAQAPGERPAPAPDVEVVNPRARAPVSLIIDDATCLVNLNRFSIPQFAAAMNYKRYYQDWRSMPYEIPDRFVRRFGEWSVEHGVKGKYSIVPFPACVGRLDLELPGWTSLELKASIDLVRSLMTRNWDIHPELVTHTRIIDLHTGHPYPEHSPRFMENWDWTVDRSADEIAAYMAYALQILKNIDLPCEGITTPGGFGHQVPPALARATLQSCRDIYGAEIPHYFRWVYSSGTESVKPRVEFAAGLDGPNPECVVSIIGCTSDWTGGWDCSNSPAPDRFITADLSSGRLVEVIERGEPACLVCHWTGIYYNGRELGFKAFQEVIRRLNEKYDHLFWMKNSEIARYWAARELTAFQRHPDRLEIKAPFACPSFTIRVPAPASPPRLSHGSSQPALREVRDRRRLEPQTWMREDDHQLVCFDLPKGASTLRWPA